MRSSIIALLLLLPCTLIARQGDHYSRAEALARRVLEKLSPPTDTHFDFKQTSRRLAHLSRPWKTWQSEVAGTFLIADGASTFYRADSVVAREKVYRSFAYFGDTTLATIGFGESVPSESTIGDRRRYLYTLSTMTPLFLLRDFLAHDRSALLRHVTGPADSIVYRRDDGVIMSLAIAPDGSSVESASILYSHAMYGDVTKRITFSDYASSEAGRFSYPTRIVERELGIESTTVTVSAGSRSLDRAGIMAMIPATHRLELEPPESAPEITRSRYNAHIHLIGMKHTGSLVPIVEFSDFLAVLGAPLNTRNGELVLREAEKIAPGKPVRYFLFGHHHPHYLGGIRAFVHAGATVVSPAMDTAYIRQLVSFRHTLRPDSLELEPRPLKLDIFDSTTTISDGELEMQVILIGSMSQHADDFLIFYFPKLRLLYQEELIGIMKEKPLTAAGPRQKGLYDAIVRHGLDVETILQSWPWEDSAKNEFTFEELRRSVKMIPPAKQSE